MACAGCERRRKIIRKKFKAAHLKAQEEIANVRQKFQRKRDRGLIK